MMNIKHIKTWFAPFLIVVAMLISGCGGGSNSTVSGSTQVVLSIAEIITALTNAGFTCSSNQVTEIKGSLAYNNTTQCPIPNQNGLQIAVRDAATSQFGTLDAATGAFTADNGTLGDAFGLTKLNEFNLAPQIENTSGQAFDKVSKVISDGDTLTATALQSIIAGLIDGTGLNPVIIGKFDVTVIGDDVTPQTIIQGNTTSLNLIEPIGPNYQLTAQLPIHHTDGSSTGVTANLTLANSTLTLDAINASIANGNYTLGEIVLTDNQGGTVRFPNTGKITINKCPPGSVSVGNGFCA